MPRTACQVPTLVALAKAERKKVLDVQRSECRTHARLRREARATIALVPESSDPDGRNRQIGAMLRQQAKDAMINNGYCHHQVDDLSVKYDLSTFRYLATLERSPARVRDHQHCWLRDSCIAFNTDPATYQTQHTTSDCECSVISVPYQSLLGVIRRGDIPLISIESDPLDLSESEPLITVEDDGIPCTSRIKLQVKARSRKSRYVAVSHVWADGLGNPILNGLPSCQLERLQSILQGLPEVRSLRGPSVSYCSPLY